VPGLP